MLNAFSRVAAETGMDIGCYFEPVNEGAIAVESFSSRLTPVGQAFSLHKAHHGNRVVEAVCSDPNGLVDGLASVDAQAGTLAVTLVNLSPEDQVDVRLEFSGDRPPAPSDGILLTSQDFAPASIFEEERLTVEQGGADAVSVTIPKHSVAQIVFAGI